MGKTISLFSGYSQKENRTTNYCLLAPKIIYEENPKFASEITSGLCGYDMSDDVGGKFRQQEKKRSIVPGALIRKNTFTIFIETINFDWFYDQQLENHLDALLDFTFHSCGFSFQQPAAKMLGAELVKVEEKQYMSKKIRMVTDHEKTLRKYAKDNGNKGKLQVIFSLLMPMPSNYSDDKDFLNGLKKL